MKDIGKSASAKALNALRAMFVSFSNTVKTLRATYLHLHSSSSGYFLHLCMFQVSHDSIIF